MAGIERRSRVNVHNALDMIDGNDSDLEDYVDESSDEEDNATNLTQTGQNDSDDSDDEDNIPLADMMPTTSGTGAYRWRRAAFTTPNAEFTGLPIDPPLDMANGTPLQYFQKFISADMLDNLVANTNLYSVQKTTKTIDTSKKEMEQMIGMYLRMGLVKMSGVRQYWEMDTAYDPVCTVMSRNRFQSLLSSLHFVDNMAVTEDEKKRDKVWKIRPWLDAVRENCLKVTPEEYCSIDEMMCKYRGQTSPIRQYIKGKPHPWGFKVWGRAGMTGILHDFEVYQGGDGTRSELGQGADVVLKLTSTLDTGKNYKIYADNLFTSVPLLIRLLDRGMFYTGTLRANRMAGCSLTNEKELKKKGRGAYDSQVETNHNISAVRWFDNRAVTLLSTHTAVQPVSEANRWDKSKKSHVPVVVPAIIRDYNQHMGGIDLLDSFLAKDRFNMISRRWYIYLFWHFVMVAVVSAWNLYKRDHRLLKLPDKEMLKRRAFQSHLADALIKVNTERRGRRSAAESASPRPPKMTRRAPCTDVRQDQFGHWPEKLSKRGRCKYCTKNNTNTACRKCDVRLCFVEERNCFYDYHH